MMIEQNTEFSLSDLMDLEKVCRLSIPEEERSEFVESLREMISLASLLKDAPTDREPYSGNLEVRLSDLRADQAEPSFSRDVLLSEASDVTDGFFRVPRTVED